MSIKGSRIVVTRAASTAAATPTKEGLCDGDNVGPEVGA